ncbi:xanthine dehydrogenase family protein molybdopterin-binding subunit [Longispora albida]|uniref:xanthine dehydrogenase family protein molybdopterin-binding subunit n=1 Tax=Longispora albida TaxID=203523 RepID=UPI0003707474|nr:molybdopterin cofactor-binding domain-containing protein [Longispora albida]
MTTTIVSGRVGDSATRPDGVLKVSGEFAFASDLWADDMLWGATLRSPYPRALIRGLDIGPALALPGVFAVLTHEDVPGENQYGLEHADQPVLAVDQVRYQGEPVAIVAAGHPETARRALAAIVVAYEEQEPVTDPEDALRDGSDLVHPGGNLVRHVRIRRGDPDAVAEVVVSGEYTVGMQDQAFLGPESGLAVPAEDGGVDLFIATQWLHADQRQVAAALGMPPEKVRLILSGVGGAFGAREDVSMQIHACMLALRTGKPIKMVYSREESFHGHVHRHPARLRYTHGAARDGRLVFVRAGIVLDGGAYASTSSAVCGNAATLGFGPYDVPNVAMDARAVYTNNPPCGAMRGFGAVQACFAYESQMDKLAAALDMDPVELRVRNAMSTGSVMPTGQVVTGQAPVAELLRRVRDMPAAPAPSALPGGSGNTTHGEGVRRGVGYAIGIKNVGFSEGFDDYATARVRLELVGGEPVATVYTAAAEVGQGLVTVESQIVRTELGIERVVLAPADTGVGSAGSSSASRQTYMTGGAVRAACLAIRDTLRRREAEGWAEPLSEPADETVQWRHRPTSPLDPETGQGDAHVQYAFAAHRATVDVDTELGIVHVAEIATAQDVGRAINPQAVEGQIHGGVMQGVGLAVMEEMRISGGRIQNPSFTDYLIPTIADAPVIRTDILELGDPDSPYGLRGVGEPPTVSSTAAVAAAIRAACGRALTHVPIGPAAIAGVEDEQG